MRENKTRQRLKGARASQSLLVTVTCICMKVSTVWPVEHCLMFVFLRPLNNVAQVDGTLLFAILSLKLKLGLSTIVMNKISDFSLILLFLLWFRFFNQIFWNWNLSQFIFYQWYQHLRLSLLELTKTINPTECRGPLGREIDLGITFVKLQCLGSVSGCTCLGWRFLSELLSKTKGDRVNNYFKSLNSKSICF